MSHTFRWLTEGGDDLGEVTYEEICAFLDGRMSGPDLAEFEAMLSSFPELQLEVEDVRRDRELERREAASGSAVRVVGRTKPWFTFALVGAGATAVLFGLLLTQRANKDLNLIQARLQAADRKAKDADRLLADVLRSAEQNDQEKVGIQRQRQNLSERGRELAEREQLIAQLATQLERRKLALRDAVPPVIVSKDLKSPEFVRAVHEMLFMDDPGSASNSPVSNLQPNRVVVRERKVVLSWKRQDPSVAVDVTLVPRSTRVGEILRWDEQKYSFPNLTSDRVTVTLPSVKDRYSVVVYDLKVKRAGEISTPQTASFVYVESGR